MPIIRLQQTFPLLVLTVLANGVGNLLLSYGMRFIGSPKDWSAHEVIALFAAAFTTPAVLVGLPMLIVYFFLYLALLSRADLTFVLPMVASAFVVNALLARLVLDEKISALRWAGIALIAVGVYLVGQTSQKGKQAGVGAS